MKNFKTFYESEAAICLKEIIQSTMRSKVPTFLEQKVSNGDLQVCKDICFPSPPRIGADPEILERGGALCRPP